jgi:hypothetical protein
VITLYQAVVRDHTFRLVQRRDDLMIVLIEPGKLAHIDTQDCGRAEAVEYFTAMVMNFAESKHAVYLNWPPNAA